VIVLDTTVLVYAVGADHPLREPCRAIVRAVGQGRVAGTTTVEVIQEFAHVRARRRGRVDATRAGLDFATLLAPLVRPNDADVRRGLELFREHDQIGAFDAILTATVLNDDRLTGVVSADRAFAKIPGLRHEFPADVSIP
jgi:predicted nucleic acid-binding protein